MSAILASGDTRQYMSNEDKASPGKYGLGAVAQRLLAKQAPEYGRLNDQVFSEGRQPTKEDIDALLSQSDARSESAFDAARTALAHRQESVGAPQAADAAAAQGRRLSLAQVSSQVDARNSALSAARERRAGIRSAAFGMDDKLTSLGLSGLGYSATSEANRRAEYNQKKASNSNGGLWGTIIGAVASIFS